MFPSVAGFFSTAAGKAVTALGAMVGAITVLPLLANAFTLVVPKGFVLIRESRERPSYKTVHDIRWGVYYGKRKVLRRCGPGVYWKIPYFWSGRLVDIRRQSNPMGVTTLMDGIKTQYQLGLQLFWRRDMSPDGLVRSEYSNEGPLEQTVAELWDGILAAAERHKSKSPAPFTSIVQEVLKAKKGVIRLRYGIIATEIRRTSGALTDAQVQANGAIASAEVLAKAWKGSRINGEEKKGVAAKQLTQRVSA